MIPVVWEELGTGWDRMWGWMHTILSCSPIPSYLPPAEAEDIKVCPRCSAFIMKINDGSCNRMNCTVCGCLFCWLCLREISDVHFLRSVQGHGDWGFSWTRAGGPDKRWGAGMGAASPCPRFEVGRGSRMICAARTSRAGADCWHPVGGSWSSGLGEPGCLISGGPVGVSWHGARLCWSLPAPHRSLGSALLCPHSPSGCTFWGKRPWSRTRRILWQLGMVLGAPMVISLAAGVAVPVITIGIPIYMGRKVLAGGPGVPVVLLPTEPGSPWPLAWTDPQCSLLPTAHPCATRDGPQSLLARTFCCPPAAPASADVLSLGSGVRVGERRKGSRGAFQEHLCCGSSAVVPACP